ncbi:hypothetical protein WJ45_03730 [Burkholderia ubonensis]|nr:hypothetical protein WJ45_03730 [Burkholderia ubonensis]KVQ59655.1 hypothetical protein WK04_26825 [Burkholderia ubonensis]
MLSFLQPLVITIPVADHECAVRVAIDARQALLDVIENLDDALAAELTDERRDPVRGIRP